MSDAKRFRVALSFAGERRPFVEAVARRLAEPVGKRRVFYDNDYRAELARPNLDVYLQAIYRDKSELIVVFLDGDYEHKEWCGLEWRVVRELIKTRRGEDVMFFRFDEAPIDGLLSIDGYVSIEDNTSPDEVASLIAERLASRGPQPYESAVTTGPPRRAPTKLPQGAAELFGRDEELAWLDAAWDDPSIHVVTLVAWGGVGKSALVSKWVAGLAADDEQFAGADYFDWSFYSQGTREKGGASADIFVDKALTFFGDAEVAASNAGPHTKGSRLAELVARRRTLLVLDGLEPLQYPPGPLDGKLQDQAVAALLKKLAMTNPGLCVVTTRVPVDDLASFHDNTVDEKRLSKLSTQAGVALLESLGVRGRPQEIEKLVADVDGHALTLGLLGGYLARAHGGDVRRRDRVDLSKADQKIQGGHAFKTMAAYETWLAQGGDEGARQLAVLQILGLFDRPANHDLLDALRHEPVLAGLTEPLIGLDEEDWNLVVSDLVEHRLVTRVDEAGQRVALDAHPLLREYFAKQLQKNTHDTWQAAHGRLFDHLCETTEHQPDTLAGLQPLYQALAHGCWAGREQQTCDDVYWKRISRGAASYVVNQLGAIGADLGAIACFFETPWSQVSTRLSESDRAWLLHQAAFRLRALGRLHEALEPMRAGLQMWIEQEDWKNAATGAANLSELGLPLGAVEDALRDAERAVDFADQSSDEFQRLARRSNLANLLAQAGKKVEALQRFREAEAMQKQHGLGHPLLYSLRGFQYCDLLLVEVEREAWRATLGVGVVGDSEGRRASEKRGQLLKTCGEIKNRTTQTLALVKIENWLLDIGLDHLTLGRCGLYRLLLAEGAPPPKTTAASALDGSSREIETAVDGLRRAGHQQYLPPGLLTRAWLRFLEGRPDAARADLDEAWEIASAGPMPILQADVHLHRARLFRDRAELAEARRLIDKLGYGRRRGELEDAEAVAESWD